MNVHIPQTLEADTELRMLSATKYNMITPQSSSSIITIVQDSLTGVFMMTKGITKMRKDQFFNICMKGINIDGSIWSSQFILDKIQHIRMVLKRKGKKVQAFNGKGLFSMILPNNFNYENNNKADPDEPIVKIYRGVIYEGAICKKDNQLIQLLHKEYDCDVAATYVDNIQFITNEWLGMHGFSVGLADCMATKSEEIDNVIAKCFMEAKGIEETTYHPGIREMRVNAALSKARDIGLRIAKTALSDDNNFIVTVTSGSKGDFFNIAQITGLLGQQNIGGKRVQPVLNHGRRTLPHYPFSGMSKEMEYESRGFIRHSFLHGLNPQEFWFHAMSGREGITDTAMGTSKSGYIQRRIVKVMEDIQVRYDGTVRNTQGNIFQMAYGDDGFDASKMVKVNGNVELCDISRLTERLNTEHELKSEGKGKKKK